MDYRAIKEFNTNWELNLRSDENDVTTWGYPLSKEEIELFESMGAKVVPRSDLHISSPLRSCSILFGNEHEVDAAIPVMNSLLTMWVITGRFDLK